MKKYSGIIIVLVALMALNGCSWWSNSNTDQSHVAEVKEQTPPPERKNLPKEAIVSFYLEPKEMQDIIIGQDYKVKLMMDTKNEEIYQFSATFKYYAPRVTLNQVKMNTSLKSAVSFDDTKEGYVSMKSSKMKKPLKGVVEIAEISLKAFEEGTVTFDVSKGSLEAKNDKGENIANIFDVDKIRLKAIKK